MRAKRSMASGFSAASIWARDMVLSSSSSSSLLDAFFPSLFAVSSCLRRRRRRGSVGPAVSSEIFAVVVVFFGVFGHLVGRGSLVGGVEIEDVAQQHFLVVERLGPLDDGVEGDRALAQAADHHVAAGLDPLGDGDFALAAEQLDRAHFAQVHAHRIVGPLAGASFFGAGRASSWRPSCRPCPRSISSTSSASSSAASASSSLSTICTPMSDRADWMSSIWSELISPCGKRR